MLPKIVAVTGFAGCGKDTFADVLVAEAGYEKVAFGDAAARECSKWLGLTVQEFRYRFDDFRPMIEQRVRERLAAFSNYWRDYVRAVIRYSAIACRTTGDVERFVVPDVTSLADAEYLQSLGAEIVRVVRDGVLNPTTDEERRIHGVPYDYYVDGYGVEHLREMTRDLLRRWRESS